MGYNAVMLSAASCGLHRDVVLSSVGEHSTASLCRPQETAESITAQYRTAQKRGGEQSRDGWLLAASHRTCFRDFHSSQIKRNTVIPQKWNICVFLQKGSVVQQ